jgi:hypothetical protein
MSPVTLAIVGLQAKPASFGTIVSAFLGACKKPVLLAPIIGVIFVLTGVQMPEPLEQSFLLAGEVSCGGGAVRDGADPVRTEAALRHECRYSGCASEHRAALACRGTGVGYWLRPGADARSDPSRRAAVRLLWHPVRAEG